MSRKSGHRFSEKAVRQSNESRAHPASPEAGCALARPIDFPLVVERHALSIATYGIGTMAAFWFIERLVGFAI
jgi:hypothetical protein